MEALTMLGGVDERDAEDLNQGIEACGAWSL